MNHEVISSVQDGIAMVTLNRPEAMNSMTVKLYDELRQVIEELQTRSDVRVVIITGAGDKSFSVGGDIRELESLSVDDRWEQHIKKLSSINTAVENLPVPVIAAINGFALGGGLELALACDIRIAAECASFGVPEVTIGGFPGTGGAVRLPRLIGKGKARELLFTGKRIDAEEADRIGLVEEVVPPAKLMDEAMKLARRIADNSPLGIRAVKQVINQGSEKDTAAAMELSDSLRRPLLSSKDYAEGLTAFKEKRKPRFVGE